MTSTLLKTDKATIRFGGLIAVKDFDLDVTGGQVFGLIGPNGAGKTTVFNLLTGVYQPTSGDITLKGKSLVGLRPNQIAARGLARTFQNIRLFGQMTVLENVKTACHGSCRATLLDTVLGTARHHAEERRQNDFALELLDIFKLSDVREERASSLPYGDQRRLEIARALATRPSVLLLDEPAAGMNPQESIELMKLIRWIRDKFDLTVVLVEHNMKVVMGACDRIQVLEYGQTIAVGTPEEIRNDQRVIAAYLGA